MSKLGRAFNRLDESAMGKKAWWARSYLRLRFAVSGNTVEDFGSGNVITHEFARVEKSQVTFMGSNNRVELGPGASMRGTRLTVIGSNCRVSIGSKAGLASNFLWITEDNSELRIGNNTTISESQVVMTDKNCRIRIGDDCIIALGSDLRCGDGHAVYNVLTGEILNRALEIVIEDHVWVAADCKILKNVRVGTGSIIATRAIVTHDVPARVIAAGAPAKVIRANVSWRREGVDRLPSGWFSQSSTADSEIRSSLPADAPSSGEGQGSATFPGQAGSP